MAAAAALLRLIPAGIKGVQQLRKAVKTLVLRLPAVLGDGQEAEILGFPVPQQQAGAIVPRVHALPQGLHLLRQGVVLPAAAGGQLPAEKRREAGEAVQQPLVRRAAPIRPGDQAPIFLRRRLKEGALLLGGGHAVKAPGQQMAQGVAPELHPAHTVDDAPVLAYQDHIGAAADQLHHQALVGGHAQFVPGVQLQDQHPLPVRLGHGGNARAHQVLAQQHTEHGRLRGIFKAGSGHMDPGVPRPGGQQQPQILPLCPQGEQQQIPLGLLHLVDPPLGDALLQLRRQGVNTDSVKWHVLPP